MASLPQALRLADQDAKNRDAGMADMFGFTEHVSLPDSPSSYDEQPDWDDDTRLLGEKETLGLYLTGHPINQYLVELRHFTSCAIADLQAERKKVFTIAGLIIGMRVRPNKRGDKIATVTLDDRSGRIDVNLFAETYARFQDLLIRDKVIVVQGEVRYDDYAGGLTMRVQDVYDIERAREQFARGLHLSLSQEQLDNEFIATLTQTLTPFREGGCLITADYCNRQASTRLHFGEAWRVRPSDSLLQRLRQWLGEEAVRVVY